MTGAGVAIGKDALKAVLPKSAIKKITGTALGGAAEKVADFLFKRELEAEDEPTAHLYRRQREALFEHLLTLE